MCKIEAAGCGKNFGTVVGGVLITVTYKRFGERSKK
jgi:hypothetical protein